MDLQSGCLLWTRPQRGTVMQGLGEGKQSILDQIQSCSGTVLYSAITFFRAFIRVNVELKTDVWETRFISTISVDDDGHS
jgi:hypothetical protein